MRKVIVFIAESLDGFIAGPKGEINWLFSDQDYGYTPFYRSVDTLIMGRKTYELGLTFPDWPYTGKRVIVFSRKQKRNADARVEFATDPVKTVKALRKKRGKNVWVVGGGTVVSALLAAHLIDELRVFVHPIVLGKGIPLFTGISRTAKLRLSRTKRFSSGLVEMAYTALPRARNRKP